MSPDDPVRAPRTVPAGPAAAPELTAELRAAIRGVDAVVDLAPTLRARARELGGKLLPGGRLDSVGGIEVTMSAERAAVVTVDLSAAARRPTLATAREVQRTVRSVLAAHGLECASVEVSVLSLRL